MMRLNEFIESAILSIRNAITEVNNESDTHKAFMPDHIDIEVYVDNEGFVGNGGSKITMRIHTANYPWLKGKNGY